MSRPPHAREKVLDAAETLLISEGERATTLDAVARAAGVSKGGLLYHFGSKEALEAGLIERLDALSENDAASIEEAAGDAVAYFLRTSLMIDSPLDRAIVAVSRLAQGGNAPARDAIARLRDRWASSIRPHVRDDTALTLVLLVSDGLYFASTIEGAAATLPDEGDLDALIDLVRRTAT